MLKTTAASVLICVLAIIPEAVRADAGPPYLTNDPGTPGNGNWEINLAAMASLEPHFGSYQLPQIDLNFGLGDRIQLTYEVPYVLDVSSSEAHQTAWGNALPGVKWRFFDEGEDGWQLSTFPQLQLGAPGHSVQTGIGASGSRLLVPIEIAKRAGPLDLDFEAGYYAVGHAPRERILGFVLGGSPTERLELDFEAYSDHVMGASSGDTTLDVGGRYKINSAFIALFMAGHSVGGTMSGQPEYITYVGIQILLSDYGLKLQTGK